MNKKLRILRKINRYISYNSNNLVWKSLPGTLIPAYEEDVLDVFFVSRIFYWEYFKEEKKCTDYLKLNYIAI